MPVENKEKSKGKQGHRRPFSFSVGGSNRIETDLGTRSGGVLRVGPRAVLDKERWRERGRVHKNTGTGNVHTLGNTYMLSSPVLGLRV